jgi:hypothetical protein
LNRQVGRLAERGGSDDPEGAGQDVANKQEVAVAGLSAQCVVALG